jgi:epoxyqueuosine reductase QueG
MVKIGQDFLQEMKKKLDVDLIGVASVKTSKELKERASVFLPTAKSVLVLGKETYPEVVALLGPSKGAGEAEPGEVFGVHADYVNSRLNRALHELADLLHKQGYRSIPLPAAVGVITDQRFLAALFSYKRAAVLAGLGTIGRNSLLITPEFGPRIRLACLVTDAVFEPSPKTRKDYCVGCDACIRVCPARAIQTPEAGQDYAMNRFACRAYRQVGLVCSVCLKVCDQVTTASKRKGKR